MALTSALYTGLSGLDVNQARLGVVGNNIANANSTAFKSSRALFKPQFYVTDSGGSSPSDAFGGTNPNQRGLGAEVAAIDRDFTNGQIEPTGKPTDMAIDGAGFFIVKGDTQQFTRDGTFTLNASHELVTQGGAFVQGYAADEDGTINTAGLEKMTIPLGSSTTAKPTTDVKMQGNLNSSGTVGTGASILNSTVLTTVGGLAPPTGATLLTDVASNAAAGTPIAAVGDKFTLAGKKNGRTIEPPKTFEVTATTTLTDFATFLQQGMGVNTTVPDDGNALTPAAGITLDADAAGPNAVHLTLTGNLGTENGLTLDAASLSKGNGASPISFLDGTNAAGIKSNPSGESVHTSFTTYDTLGNEVNVDVTAVLETKANTGNVWRFFATSGDDTDANSVVGTGTLTFDNRGVLKDSTGTGVTIDRNATGAKEPLSFDLDFGTVTSVATDKSSIVMTQQDGHTAGTLDTFSIGADGKIVGQYSNGQNKNLGQLALATFANMNGLVDKGGNNFTAGADSGLPVISTPTDQGAGQIRGASLEQSNVDISKEFVNLIISSTGFSAASKVITTSDQLIQELLNSTR